MIDFRHGGRTEKVQTLWQGDPPRALYRRTQGDDVFSSVRGGREARAQPPGCGLAQGEEEAGNGGGPRPVDGEARLRYRTPASVGFG